MRGESDPRTQTFTVRVTELATRCVIGIHPAEREREQPLHVDVELAVSLPAVVDRQSTEGVVDYASLAERLLAELHARRFFLLEVAAHALARLCLEDPRVLSATVRIAKPEAVPAARAVSVECALTRRTPAGA